MHRHDDYDAFCLLSGSRPVGMAGEGPIPLSEVEAYCRLYGVSGIDEIEDFVRIIRGLDREYLDLRRDESEAAKKLPAKK